ncbi:DUF5602 domain-containing protein [Emticicia sp. BO119]|uniref:DUF5602 domain-containing protein n=1 Tax=Emticicia sp. BO119 TaxID=2757768 RepID=UPI0015F0D4FE|nr:DUF5602 domain-containing protein [Emticicia sp. BO119]MBA4852288.1 DUF5602 domain-containing protein [Emticicia sp. BO119]
MKHLFTLTLVTLVLLMGCEKNEEDPGNPTYKGTEQTLGNGKVYSWVTFAADNNPLSIGITLTKGALDNIPHTGVALVLALPSQAVGKTPFSHIMIDYLHTGHEPPGTYDVAHFDMHFYIQSQAEREAIPAYPVAPAKFDNLPPAGYIPNGYIRLPAGVPAMGVHWADPKSPELAGTGKFTETLIYGSYDGKMTFIEPMIAHEFLKGSPNVNKLLPLPTKFEKAGYYPMNYSIRKVGDDIQVSLDAMMLMQ